MIRRVRLLTLVPLLVIGGSWPASGQQRPLATHDPEVVGAGQVLIEAGFDYGRDQLFSASGLKGDLLRVPLFGVTVGLGSLVDLQVTGGPYNTLKITSTETGELSDLLAVDGDSTTSAEDLMVATRVRLLEEADGTPAVALRIATRVPFASVESGLGLGTMDFYSSALVGKTAGSLRIVGNLGLGVLGSPERGRTKATVVAYGASIARAMTDSVEVVGELNGRANLRTDDPPAGTEDRSMLRVGARYTRGAARLDAGILIGLTARDPGFGLTAGFTFALKAFTVR